MTHASLPTSDLRRAALAFAVACSTLAAPIAHATPDARNQAEIDSLLQSISSSGCTFIRSGQEYTGTEARKHLQTKLDFVRWRLQTVEQFIDKLASTSSSTGEPYLIRCGANQTLARGWLDSQLKVVRGQR